MISIFLNSRSRVYQLKTLLNSIQINSINPKNIEVLIAIDSDDQQSIQFSQLDHTYNFDLQFIINEYRPNNLHVSMNNLAKKTKGDYLFVLNDDTNIINYGWDDTLKNIDSNQIYYLRTFDNSCDKVNDKMYSSFPILTRTAYNALGYFMSEKFVGLGADAHLWRLFNSINRIQDINVQIDHIFHRSPYDVMNPDETARHMRNNSWSNNIDPWTLDLNTDIMKLLNSEEF